MTWVRLHICGHSNRASTCQLFVCLPKVFFFCFVVFLAGGVQLICNNMVTSTRAIVNTARSMVSTIMKFLDSSPGKAADGSLKARVLASEPDNAEGLHNFAPLGTCTETFLC